VTPRGTSPAGQPQFICYYLENTKLKAKNWSKDLFCFPELKLNLNHYSEVFSEIKLELIFSVTLPTISSE